MQEKLFLLLLVILPVFTACSGQNGSTEEVYLDDLYQSIDQDIANANRSLPQATYERITRVQREGKKLIITALIGLDLKSYNELLKHKVKKYTTDNLCKSPEIKWVLGKGIEVEYRYYLNDNSKVTININRESCET